MYDSSTLVVFLNTSGCANRVGNMATGDMIHIFSGKGFLTILMTHLCYFHWAIPRDIFMAKAFRVSNNSMTNSHPPEWSYLPWQGG